MPRYARSFLLFILCGLPALLACGAAAQSGNLQPTAHLPIIIGGARGPMIGGCQVFPQDNIWNRPITDLPRDPRSDAYIASIGANGTVHADFGAGLWAGGPIGIPFVVVPAGQAPVDIQFDPDGYPDESDPGPFPIPPDAPIEGGPNSSGDRHVLVVARDTCTLYELYKAFPNANGSWMVYSSAVYNLSSHALRPDGWTSADAAGLPIMPGLVRREEVEAGLISHALRFTAPRTRRAYVWPARHFASNSNDPALPPMGQRFRLRADFDISSFSRDNRVILTALKTYGMILADNGSSWYISGAPHENWDNDDLRELGRIKGSDFEAVDQSALMVNPDSGQARP